MKQEEIDLLSDTDFNNIYLERLYRLRAEIKEIAARLKKKSKSFTPNQQLIIDMITTSKNSAIIIHNGLRVQFSTGSRKHGLKHILMRHYCDNCEGKISAIDIISIERFLKDENKFSENKTTYGYKYTKDHENSYKLILFKDINAEGVLSVYKIDTFLVEEGANSP